MREENGGWLKSERGESQIERDMEGETMMDGGMVRG